MDGGQCMATTSHTKPTWPWWGNALEIIPGLEQHFIEDFWAVARPSLCFFTFLTCSSCFSAHAWSAEKHFIDIVNEVNHHIDIVGTGHLKEGYREGFSTGFWLSADEGPFYGHVSLWHASISHLNAQPKGMGFSYVFMFGGETVKPLLVRFHHFVGSNSTKKLLDVTPLNAVSSEVVQQLGQQSLEVYVKSWTQTQFSRNISRNL